MIMTLTVPLLALLGIGICKLVMTMSDPQEEVMQVIGYVDEVGIFDDHTDQGSTRMVPFVSREDAARALVAKEVSEYFIIPSGYRSSGTVHRFTLEKELVTPWITVARIKSFLVVNLLKEEVPPELITLIVSPLNLEVTRVSDTGDAALDQGNMGNLIIPGVFSLLLGLALMSGASSLISGLGEEKESRLIEVLFSSVSVGQLLISKVLALGLAGLLQVLVWLISAPLLLCLASSTFGGFMSEIRIPGGFLLLGVVYFVLGYLLFAVLSVGIGAISSTAREGGNLSLFYILLGFAPLWFGSLLFPFPHSPIWVVLTIFPVTAPVQTMLRLGVSDIPPWQIAVSIGVLVISIVAGLCLSIKLFRVYILMYGKRPGMSEMIRCLKNS